MEIIETVGLDGLLPGDSAPNVSNREFTEGVYRMAAAMVEGARLERDLRGDLEAAAFLVDWQAYFSNRDRLDFSKYQAEPCSRLQRNRL